MAVNGVFEDFHVLLKCVFIGTEGVLQNIFSNVLTCALEPLLAGPPYSSKLPGWVPSTEESRSLN